MRVTIDKAGRVVIPKQLRDQVGLAAGEVELTVEGAGVRIEPVAGSDIAEVGGRLVVPKTGHVLTAADVDALRRADQR